MKIQNRITLNFTLVVASILLLFASIVYVIRIKFREEAFYNRLNEKAQSFARFLVEAESQTLVPGNKLRFINPNMMFGESIIACNEKGEVIYDSGIKLKPSIPATLRKEILRKGTVRFTDGSYQTVGISYTSQGEIRLVLVSAYDRYGIKSLNNLFNILLFGFLISTAIVFFLGRNFARRSLRPVQALVQQIEDIKGNDLAIRVDSGENRDEIHYLAEKFNELLARLNNAFLLQKSFISNASHELRNPFAAIIGQIDVALLKARSPEEYASTLSSIREDIKRLTNLTNQLLLLAQTNNLSSHAMAEDLRIDDLLWQVQAEMKALHPGYGVDIAFSSTPDDATSFIVSGNAALLKTAFHNLIDNACKYSKEHRCLVEISFEAYVVLLRFIDAGPAIPKEEGSLIFEPFYRSERSAGTPGHGIGLSLVKNIIQLHGGAIQLQSPESGGNTFILRIPSKGQQNSYAAPKL